MSRKLGDFIVISEENYGGPLFFPTEEAALIDGARQIREICSEANDGVDGDLVREVLVGQLIARGDCDNPDVAYQIQTFSLHDTAAAAKAKATEAALRDLVNALDQITDTVANEHVNLEQEDTYWVGGNIGHSTMMAARAALRSIDDGKRKDVPS